MRLQRMLSFGCVLIGLSGLGVSAAAESAPSLQPSVGHRLTVQGEAVNSKAGAAVLTDQHALIFIDDIPSWGRDSGRRVEVRGVLRQKKLIPDVEVDQTGAISQGADGSQYVMSPARWKFLSPPRAP